MSFENRIILLVRLKIIINIFVLNILIIILTHLIFSFTCSASSVALGCSIGCASGGQREAVDEVG